MAQNVDIETRVERTIANLERHNFSAVFVTNESQFHAKIKEWLPESSTVGDSVTLFETGVIELLRNGKYNSISTGRKLPGKKRSKYTVKASLPTFFYAAPTP